MSWWDDTDGDDSDADEPYGQYDESSVRVRPNPKGNRPRTKTRPTYDDAPVGWVTNVDRGRFGVLIDDHVITATKAREPRQEVRRHGRPRVARRGRLR